MQFLSLWNSLLWQYILPVLLTAAAVICGIRQKGRPVRGFCRTLRELCGGLLLRRESTKQRRIFANALAAAMGTGNLFGTALALMTGGAGAVFWMWISALLGMFLVYAENMLGIRFRKKHPDGTVTGGAAGYLRYGTGSRFAAGFFAFCCTAAALGMGDLAQSSTVSQTACRFGLSPAVSGILTAGLLCVLLHGGTERTRTFTSRLMPLLCGAYLLGCGYLIFRNRDALPDALLRILREAFGIRAAGCGCSAGLMLQSAGIGLRRGIFSNEAGLGSSALLHMDADSGDPVLQGKWAAFEVFLDTAVCCTMTALVILTAPGCDPASAQDAGGLLLQAFSGGFGKAAEGFLAVCTVLFALAAMIGWYPCGAACTHYLFGKNGTAVFAGAYILLAFAGALGSPAWIWALCDCCNGMMALPNLWGILKLSGNCRTDALDFPHKI